MKEITKNCFVHSLNLCLQLTPCILEVEVGQFNELLWFQVVLATGESIEMRRKNIQSIDLTKRWPDDDIQY